MSASPEQNYPLPSPEKPSSNEFTVFKSFKTIDVTEPTADNITQLFHARVLIANEYMGFHKTFQREMSIHDRERLNTHVFEKLCVDEYSTPDRSRTLVALDKDGSLAGTLRFVFGEVNPQTGAEDSEDTRQRILHPIETMALMESKDPATTWPQQESGHIAEVGRLAVSADQRPKGNTPAILRSLMEKAFDEARAREIAEINIVMPSVPPRRLYKALRRAGLQPKLVSGITVRTDDEARGITEEFPGYWKQKPRLYTFAVPPKSTK